MSKIYKLSKEQLEKIADEVKRAVIVSLHAEEIVRYEDAVRWRDSHRIIFDLDSQEEDKDFFKIKVVKIVAG